MMPWLSCPNKSMPLASWRHAQKRNGHLWPMKSTRFVQPWIIFLTKMHHKINRTNFVQPRSANSITNTKMPSEPFRRWKPARRRFLLRTVTSVANLKILKLRFRNLTSWNSHWLLNWTKWSVSLMRKPESVAVSCPNSGMLSMILMECVNNLMRNRRARLTW